jgi:hypothetical protein
MTFSLREKLINVGAKVASHGRYVTFHMVAVAVPRQMIHMWTARPSSSRRSRVGQPLQLHDARRLWPARPRRGSSPH